MDFSSEGVAEVERALEATRPGRWRRLSEREFARGERVSAIAGWNVAIPTDTTRVGAVDRFLLFMDRAFPFSELRVAVPGMKGVEWPHVEADEFLCLEPTSARSSTLSRVQAALEDAQALLNWDAAQCRSEFGREIQAYWRRRAIDTPQLFSLADPAGPTRQAFYCPHSDGYLVADHEEDAHRWLRNATGQKEQPRLRRTLVIRLPAPIPPSEYPTDGAALLEVAGSEVLQPFLALNRELPILLAFETESGRGFVGLLIQSPTRGGKVNGYRPGKEPAGRRVSFASMPTRLCRVERLDRSWAFGRDHGDEVAKLQKRRIALIGCGALGGTVGLALVQAGIANLVSIDNDIVHAHNPARHVLGTQYLRWPKALALTAKVRRLAPTVSEVLAWPKHFEALSQNELGVLAKCDLVICAGVDRRGEVHVDRWRRGLDMRPPLICTFSEEFALVGHAIAIFGSDHLAQRYNPDGNFDFLATEWPKELTMIREAGCGNDFQPFGMVDLMPTAQMATRLALDVLSEKVSSSLRRTWFGDRDRVTSLGGKAGAAFTGSESMHEYPWDAR